MSGHLLEQQPEERIFTRIKELQDQIKELRTPQQQGSDVVKVAFSGGVTQSQTVGANSGGYMGVVGSNGDGTPTFNVIESVFYQDTDSDPAHEIGSTLNNYRDLWDLDVQRLISATTVTCNYRLYYFNHDTVSHTIYWHERLRYILRNT